MTQNNNKRPYVKPSMTVYPLKYPTRLLQSSDAMPIDPNNPTSDQW